MKISGRRVVTQAKFSKNFIKIDPTPPSKLVIFLTIVILICLSVGYSWGIARPRQLIWDEQHHVPAAQSYLRGDKNLYRDLRNPPLGKEFIALSIEIFGDNYFAYRLPAALSAAAIGALLFLVGTWLTASWGGGALSLFLWISSSLALLHARLGMLDMPTSLFFFAGLAAFLPVLNNPQGKTRCYWIILACFLTAAGGMIKVIVFVLYPIFALALWECRMHWPLRQSLPRLLGAASFWTLALLLLTYGVIGFSPGEIPRQWKLMLDLQTQLHKDYSGLSRWYEWFWGGGSLWYRSKPLPTGISYAALCKQNPVLWFAGILSTIGMFVSWCRSRRPTELAMASAVLAQIVFWMLFKEQQILTYALPMEPFFCLNSAYLLKKLLKNQSHFFIWGLCLAGAAFFFLWKSYPQVLGTYMP
ncbi:MAG: hypothetical protein U1F66_05225 [bacterium]